MLWPVAPHIDEVVHALRTGDVLVVEPPHARAYVAIVVVSSRLGVMAATCVRERPSALVAANRLDSNVFMLVSLGELQAPNTLATLRQLAVAATAEHVEQLVGAINRLCALAPDLRARADVDAFCDDANGRDEHARALAAAMSSAAFALSVFELAAFTTRTKAPCQYDAYDWLDGGDVTLAFARSLVVRMTPTNV